MNAKRKFFRVYTGPGYPTEPSKRRARKSLAYVNSFNPINKTHKHETLDYEGFNKWIAESAN